MRFNFPVLIGIASILIFSCTETAEKKDVKTDPIVKKSNVPVPDFNEDSAYFFIQKQVSFGPRVPNSKAHKECAAYLEKTLRAWGLQTQIQTGEVIAFDGKKLQIKNIIARYKPEVPNRVLLYAHWDTRPFADRDDKDMDKAISGANDGGSGVGVLMEIARLISQKNGPNIGIDIIFFDAEDYGQPSKTNIDSKQNTWCLGSQYFANHMPIANYRPKYGILLDMVGAKTAVFPKEGNSMKYAPDVVEKVWNTAASLGYGDYFVDTKEPYGITDDHLYINTLSNIPSIDIIHYHVDRSDFGPFHHRHSDNMDVIDKNTLKAVGQTLLEVVYNE